MNSQYIPVKINMIDIRLCQPELTTLLKKRRDSTNRVCQCNLWSRVVTEIGVELDTRDVLRVKYAHRDQLCEAAPLTIELRYSNRGLTLLEDCSMSSIDGT